jgi:hypothetical protein
MQACVETPRQAVNPAPPDKIADQRHRSFRRIRHDAKSAIGELLESHQMEPVHRHVLDERFV